MEISTDTTLESSSVVFYKVKHASILWLTPKNLTKKNEKSTDSFRKECLFQPNIQWSRDGNNSYVFQEESSQTHFGIFIEWNPTQQ